MFNKEYLYLLFSLCILWELLSNSQRRHANLFVWVLSKSTDVVFLDRFTDKAF